MSSKANSGRNLSPMRVPTQLLSEQILHKSPFKKLRRNEKLALLILMKIEKFILRRKYYALYLLKAHTLKHNDKFYFFNRISEKLRQLP
jgi:hypothetical protein